MESAVTTNGEKSAEAIVGGNSEGLNEIQFMNFTNCTKVSQNSLRDCLKGIKAGNLTRRKGVNRHDNEAYGGNPK